MKRLIPLIGFMLLFAACSDEDTVENDKSAVNKSENSAVSTSNALTLDALVGTYEGKLPCASCEQGGYLSTHIILNENNTYSIATLPEKDTVFSNALVDSGKFVMRDSVLELTDVGGEIVNYKISKNGLIQLGSDGMPLDKPGESNYQFVKK